MYKNISVELRKVIQKGCQNRFTEVFLIPLPFPLPLQTHEINGFALNQYVFLLRFFFFLRKKSQKALLFQNQKEMDNVITYGLFHHFHLINPKTNWMNDSSISFSPSFFNYSTTKKIKQMLPCSVHGMTRHSKRSDRDRSLKCLECMSVNTW